MLKAVHRVQHKVGYRAHLAEVQPSGRRAHGNRPQPAILARGSTPAGVKLARENGVSTANGLPSPRRQGLTSGQPSVSDSAAPWQRRPKAKQGQQ